MAGTYTLPGVLLSGVHSSRPAASAVASGTLFAETDTGQTYQSDGVSTWTAWGAVAGGGGGGGGIPPFPTWIETVNFASASSGTQTITLAGTPSTGDVIFVAAGNVQFPVTGITGAGATWYRVGGRYYPQGDNSMLDLWMGVVGGSPSTGITVTWLGSNTYYGAAVVYRGLSGKIEMCVGSSTADDPANGEFLMLPSMSSARSPIAIAAFFSRTTGSPAAAGGFTSLTSASAGADRADLLYLDTSAGINVGQAISGVGSGHSCILAALIY